MKILIDALGASTGGNITILNNLLYHFLKFENDMIVIVFIELNSFEKNQLYRHENVEYIPIANYSSLVKKVIWQQIVVQNKAKKIAAEILLSITNCGSFFPKVKTIVYFHQSLLFTPNIVLKRFFRLQALLKFKIQKLIVLSGFLKCTNIIVQTETVKKSIISKYPKLAKKIVVCYPGVNLKIFGDKHYDNSAIKKQVNKSLSFLFLSHPAEYKNFEILFNAAKILKEKNLYVKFVLTLEINQENIFNKRYRSFINSYLKAINGLDVLEYFDFKGIILSNEEKNELIDNSDFLLNPSFVESFPLTYAEGMFLKKPFLSAERPYAREICGDSSLYFNPDSAFELAELIAETISSIEIMQQLSINSGRRSRFYDPEKNWKALYNYIKLI